MKNTEVTDEKLREIVRRLKITGLPEPIRLESFLPKMTASQEELIGQLAVLATREKEIRAKGIKPGKDNEAWQVREDMRRVLQKAILADLITLGLIQRQAIGYGAIPDPRKDWKYFLLPDGSYACWQCGGEILAKPVIRSVHYAEFSSSSLAGGGEVTHLDIPYCPACEREPADNGVINETVAESFVRENGIS